MMTGGLASKDNTNDKNNKPFKNNENSHSTENGLNYSKNYYDNPSSLSKSDSYNIYKDARHNLEDNYVPLGNVGHCKTAACQYEVLDGMIDNSTYHRKESFKFDNTNQNTVQLNQEESVNINRLGLEEKGTNTDNLTSTKIDELIMINEQFIKCKEQFVYHCIKNQPDILVKMFPELFKKQKPMIKHNLINIKRRREFGNKIRPVSNLSKTDKKTLNENLEGISSSKRKNRKSFDKRSFRSEEASDGVKSYSSSIKNNEKSSSKTLQDKLTREAKNTQNLLVNTSSINESNPLNQILNSSIGNSTAKEKNNVGFALKDDLNTDQNDNNKLKDKETEKKEVEKEFIKRKSENTNEQLEEAIKNKPGPKPNSRGPKKGHKLLLKGKSQVNASESTKEKENNYEINPNYSELCEVFNIKTTKENVF